MTQPFSSIASLALQHRVILPVPRYWRLLAPEDCRHGEINAIITLRGKAVATNGIMLAILTENETRIEFGHKEFFVPDKEERDNDHEPKSRKQSERTRKILLEYC